MRHLVSCVLLLALVSRVPAAEDAYERVTVPSKLKAEWVLKLSEGMMLEKAELTDEKGEVLTDANRKAKPVVAQQAGSLLVIRIDEAVNHRLKLKTSAGSSIEVNEDFRYLTFAENLSRALEPLTTDDFGRQTVALGYLTLDRLLEETPDSKDKEARKELLQQLHRRLDKIEEERFKGLPSDKVKPWQRIRADVRKDLDSATEPTLTKSVLKNKILPTLKERAGSDAISKARALQVEAINTGSAISTASGKAFDLNVSVDKAWADAMKASRDEKLIDEDPSYQKNLGLVGNIFTGAAAKAENKSIEQLKQDTRQQIKEQLEMPSSKRLWTKFVDLLADNVATHHGSTDIDAWKGTWQAVATRLTELGKAEKSKVKSAQFVSGDASGTSESSGTGGASDTCHKKKRRGGIIHGTFELLFGY